MILELVDVVTYYGDNCVLQGLSLKVGIASVVALLGRNGMGKTTTIRTIIGFTPPRAGTVRFKGKEVDGLEAYQIAHMGMGLVPQGRRIFPSLSVIENLLIAMRKAREREGWDLEQVFSYFPILKKRGNVRGNALSGGEQQMLAISRALVGNPDLLLMDEPSEGLSPLIVQSIGRMIQKLKESGISILIAEPNLVLSLSVADYVYIICNGATVHESTPARLRENREITNKYLCV